MNGDPVAPDVSTRDRAEAAMRVLLPVAVLALGIIAWELIVHLREIPQPPPFSITTFGVSTPSSSMTGSSSSAIVAPTAMLSKLT